MSRLGAAYCALLMAVLAVTSVVGGLLGLPLARRLVYDAHWFAGLAAIAAVLCVAGMARLRTPAALCGYGGVLLIILAGGMAKNGEQGNFLLLSGHPVANCRLTDGRMIGLPFALDLIQYSTGSETVSPVAIITAAGGTQRLAFNQPASIGGWQFNLTGVHRAGVSHAELAGVLCLATRNPGYPVFVAGALLLLAGSVLYGWRRVA